MRNFLFLWLAGLSIIAQEKNFDNTFITTNGKVHFFSKAPLEDIEATTTKAICVFNTSTKKVQVKIPVTSFEFRQKLMQEHFNENYMESDKYPNATFNGDLIGAVDFLKDGVYDAYVKGELNVHGVKQQREIPVKLTVKDRVPINVVSDFNIKLVDHRIKIPKAVLLNIAEVIKVDVNFNLSKYEKQ